MTFTDWEVDAIRRGLNCYRIDRGGWGHLLPWKTVTHDILMSEVTAHTYPKNGELPEFKEEALRRFANGSQILQPDKLADLKAFLIYKKILTHEEFGNASGILAEAKAMQSLLGSRTTNPQHPLPGTGAHYKATRRINHDLIEEVELRILPQQNNDFFLTEETYSLIHRPSSPEHGPDKNSETVHRKEVRRGFGFLFTGADLIHIALRGYMEGDRIHLVEFTPLCNRTYPDYFMLRLGADHPSPVEGTDFQAFLHNANALKFEVTRDSGNRSAKGV